MGRTVGKREPPRVNTVTRVELKDDGHNRGRLAAALLFMGIGAFALAYAFTQFLNGKAGWTEIQANSASELNCAEDFVFLYELGRGDDSPSVENKALKTLYTDTCVTLYRLFNVQEEFDGVNNLCYINAHPGMAIEVDPVLYHAFALAEEYGERRIYLAPVYEVYGNLFYCANDFETADYDIVQNETLAEFAGQIAEYASNAENIQVELLGDNQVRLVISPEYRDYLDTESVGQYVDFMWMKNAFIADALADVLVETGYTNGVLSSRDGFVRNLDDGSEGYSMNLYDRVDGKVYDAAVMEYEGPLALANFRNYPLNSGESYYVFEHGEVRTPYLDIADGCEKSARNNLVVYSRKMGCAELALCAAPLYIADTWDEGATERLLQSGIHSIYCEDGTFYYNDGEIAVTKLYDKDGVSYRAVRK